MKLKNYRHQSFILKNCQYLKNRIATNLSKIEQSSKTYLFILKVKQKSHKLAPSLDDPSLGQWQRRSRRLKIWHPRRLQVPDDPWRIYGSRSCLLMIPPETGATDWKTGSAIFPWWIKGRALIIHLFKSLWAKRGSFSLQEECRKGCGVAPRDLIWWLGLKNGVPSVL